MQSHLEFLSLQQNSTHTFTNFISESVQLLSATRLKMTVDPERVQETEDSPEQGSFRRVRLLMSVLRHGGVGNYSPVQYKATGPSVREPLKERFVWRWTTVDRLGQTWARKDFVSDNIRYIKCPYLMSWETQESIILDIKLLRLRALPTEII